MEPDCILPQGYGTPQGLPRVCCVGQLEELPLYREEVAGDLQRVWPCAVHFASGDGEELNFVLEQVQLAVFLITSRFLDDPDCKKAFDMAEKLHVPILPLQKEEGLEERFNRNCGSYQLLWKEDPDPTVIDYRTKLKNFLDRVFLDKTKMEDLREAFLKDYIFLSYRKKNRALAQELMKHIHDLPGRDNISIWYDEFLGAGDKWDKTIESKLDGCALMALAVTPDVVNEPNYVLDKEYPMARERKEPGPVPILPVLVAPTSRDALEAKGLIDCVDIRDDRILNGKLKKSFGKGKQGRNEKDRYRLGMAYLNGCYVEVCRERGVALLRHAAANGCLEAIQALADMYATGNGVELNYKESIRWQEKAMTQLQKSPRRGGEYLRNLLFLGCDCYSAGEFELAGKYLEQAVAFCEKLPDTASATSRLSGGVALTWLAYVLIQKPEPDFQRAEDYLQRAEELEREIMEATKGSGQKDHIKAGRELIDTLNKRNLLYRRWRQAITDERKKLELEEKAVECLRWATELSERFPGSAANDTGMLYAKSLLACGQREKAVSQAEDVLRRARQEFDGQDDPRRRESSRLHIVMCYTNLIEILLAAGEPNRVEDYIRQAEELNEPLYRAGETQALKYAKTLAYFRSKITSDC